MNRVKNKRKKVTNEFIKTLHLKTKKGPSPLSIECAKLKVGETIFISIEEWAETHLKSSPNALIVSNSFNPKSYVFGMNFSGQKAEEGWIITRKK